MMTPCQLRFGWRERKRRTSGEERTLSAKGSAFGVALTGAVWDAAAVVEAVAPAGVELGAAAPGAGAFGEEVGLAKELETAGWSAMAGSGAGGEVALGVFAASIVGGGLEGACSAAAEACVCFAVLAVGLVVGRGCAVEGGAQLVVFAALGEQMVDAGLAAVVAAPVVGAVPGVGVVFVGLDVVVGTGVAASVGGASQVCDTVSGRPWRSWDEDTHDGGKTSPLF